MPDENAQDNQQPAKLKAPRDADLTARIRDLEAALGQEEQAKSEAQAAKLQALEQRYAVERVERARAQAQVQFPKADQELLAEYPSQDPEVILAYAAKLHEKAALSMYSMNGVPLPPTNQTDAALSQQESQIRRWQLQVRNNHLRKTLDPIEAEQAFETFFARAWNEHMDARRRRAGLPIAPVATPAS
jgi:hypothetical protein